jgi:ribonuclease P protein component
LKITERYTLGKAERLKSRKLIDELFKSGRSFSNFPFRVIWLYDAVNASGLQAGFSVSARNFKKAADRNRVKRLMREAWRLQKNQLVKTLEENGNALSVFLIYTGNEIPVYSLVYEKMGIVLKRLNEKRSGDKTIKSKPE